MRCQWIVRRTMQPAPGGQRRWDRAYQEVLAWMEGPADEPVGVSRGPAAHGRPAMRVALYARVSTRRQAQAQTVEQQLERLTDHARQQGWDVPLNHIFRVLSGVAPSPLVVWAGLAIWPALTAGWMGCGA